jgi:Family of unknown function (DUF5686)/CarboxypepD_reg-like domain
MNRIIIFTLFLIITLTIPLSAQQFISGYIRDRETKEPLAAANIQIVGTFQGTISNEDGKYLLQINALPSTILVSYIGYQLQQITIESSREKIQDIYLKPILLETEPITVIAEDPAMGIMRKVIKRKQEWRKKIKTFKADAYTRFTLENDSGIVSISESVSQVFWDRERGVREVIKSKKQTDNLKANQNFAFSSQTPNFYDDDIEIMGFQIIGPTHPDALDYYQFKLLGERPLDKQIVFDIQVIPDSKLQPTFVGRISVVDSIFIMIDVELKPNPDVVRFPVPIEAWNIYYSQQFSNFGQDYFLPLDVRMNGDIKIGFAGLDFPKMGYKQAARLTNYQVNIELPDSLYENKNIRSEDSLSIAHDSLFTATKEIIPLSETEELAYREIDSTLTMEKAFKPTGFIADMAEFLDDDDSDSSDSKGSFLPAGIAPVFWFNRVDEFHIGASYEHTFFKRLLMSLESAYNTGIHRWSYGSSLEYQFGKRRTAWIKAHYGESSATRYFSESYSRLVASLYSLFAGPDYFDYYRKRGLNLQAGYKIRSINTSITLGLNLEKHTSLSKTSDRDLIGSNYVQRLNPAIDQGHLNSIELKIKYDDNYVPFGLIGQNRAEIQVEHSAHDVLISDFSYTQFRASGDVMIKTFLTRRILPNTLNIHLSAGYSSGELPVQRFAILDAVMGAFAPYGVFKSLYNRPLEGENYFGVFWEHNFRTVPFELLGLDWLVDKQIGLIAFGASGRTWISDKTLKTLDYNYRYQDSYRHEAGIAINGIFQLFRVDFTRRLDKADFTVGVSLLRWL